MSIIKVQPYIIDSSKDFTFNNVTASGNLLSLNANLGNVVSANYFSGNAFYLTNILGTQVAGEVAFADNANSVAGGNVTGQVSNALVAGTVYTNAQPNITSIGSLTGLTVSNVTGVVNFTTTANVTLGAVANLHIAGGSADYVLKTDGAGNLSWTAQSGGGGISLPSQSGHSGEYLTTDGSTLSWAAVSGGGGASVTVSGTAPSSPSQGDMWLDTGSNVLKVYVSTAWVNVSVSNSDLVSVNDNFVGDGVETEFTLTTTPVSKDYMLVAVGGVLQPRSTYSIFGNVLTLSSVAPDNTPIDVTILGGTVTTINTAATVTANSQPNITSIGTLTSLIVTGDATVGNVKTDNLLYANGSPYVFTTTASGSNTQLQFNDANSFAGSANLTFNKTTNTLAVTNITVTGTANLGAVGNMRLTGGSNGQVLTSNGAGGVSFAAPPASFTAAKAMTMSILFGG